MNRRDAYFVPVPLRIRSNEVKVDLGTVGMENELKLHFRRTLCTDPLCCIEYRNYAKLRTCIDVVCTFY